MNSNLYYIDWIIMIINLYSYYLIGCKKLIGFILGIIGSIAGIILFLTLVFSIPMIIMYIAFMILNFINYLKWKKNE